MFAGLLSVLIAVSGGCQSFLTPHQAPYQPNGCDVLGGCAGYTETQWTSLDGCGWESEIPIAPATWETQQYLEQSMSINESANEPIGEPLSAHQYVENVSYLPREEQPEKDPSLNEEVLQYANSVELRPAPSDLEIQEARHEKELDEISIEYLQ
jgi:hypothetical protein